MVQSGAAGSIPLQAGTGCCPGVLATIEPQITTAVNKAITNISNSSEQLVFPIMTQLNFLRLPGTTLSHPAVSCQEIKKLNPTAPTGHYWLRDTTHSSLHMYCDMSWSCLGITGAWMRVVKINTTNLSNHTCPEGLKLLSTPKRLCAMNSGGHGCSSATFNLYSIRYMIVCVAR